jgi:hypothetical protein
VSRLIACECDDPDCFCENLMEAKELECDDCSIGDHAYPWSDRYGDDDDDWLD